MRPIKILHIITRIDRWGSAQNTLLTVRGLSQMLEDRISEDQNIRESEKGKYEVTLVTGSVKNVDTSDINLTIIPELRREINPVIDIICLFKLYRFIKRGRFDIVHTHSSKAGFIGRIAAKTAGCPVIVHTPHGHIFYGYFNPCITQIFILLERFAAKFTDKIIGLTDSEIVDYFKFGISRTRDKFSTISDGIEIERFNKRVAKTKKEGLGIPEDSPVVISVARLVPIKGHRYLIDAVSKVVKEIPETKFLFVGEGRLKEKLKKQAKYLGVRNNVFFLGEREDIPELLGYADIFTISSLNEGMGIAIVEAMASGLPVVATKVCGIPDLVEDWSTGVLVPSRDPESLSMAILKLLKDKRLAECMGKEGKKKASLYSVEKMVEKTDTLYESLTHN